MTLQHKHPVLFQESQRFGAAFVIITVGFFSALSVFILATDLMKKETPLTVLNYLPLSFTILLSTLIIVLFAGMRLKTAVTEDGIEVQFFPFHLRPKFFAWAELDLCYLRSFDPYSEYGGIGLKGKRKDLSYSVYGDKGLQLQFKNGNKLLISTEKGQELVTLLKQLGQIKEWPV